MLADPTNTASSISGSDALHILDPTPHTIATTAVVSCYFRTYIDSVVEGAVAAYPRCWTADVPSSADAVVVGRLNRAVSHRDVTMP